jgi:hypothetical protein
VIDEQLPEELLARVAEWLRLGRHVQLTLNFSDHGIPSWHIYEHGGKARQGRRGPPHAEKLTRAPA